MGRELQKKKNRSSTPRIRQKPKSKKLTNPRANPIIAAAWDRTLSVAQNYRALGLTSKLNHRTGGVERQHRLYAADPSDPLAAADEDDRLAIGGRKRRKIGGGEHAGPGDVLVDEVRVERDPVTGKILRVLGGDGSDGEDGSALRKRKRPNPLNDPLNEIEDEYEERVGGAGSSAGGQAGRKRETAVVQALEQLAARGEARRPRRQSKRECEWIAELVAKHGENFRAMSRDRKLNPMQQTEADIRARVQRWKNESKEEEETENNGPSAADEMEFNGLDDEEEEEEDDDEEDEQQEQATAKKPTGGDAPVHDHNADDGFDDTKPRCTCTQTWDDFRAAAAATAAAEKAAAKLAAKSAA